MQLIKHNSGPIVNRLRFVMSAVILFSIITTLAGQPESFWQHPETAIRGDGLSIYSKTNRSVDFFLGKGWQPYLFANLVYFLTLFLLISALPQKAALVTIFSFIFFHFFDGCNWLAVRWHLGIDGPMLYGIILAPTILLTVSPRGSTNTHKMIKRLSWVAMGTILFDFINTLLGQPPSYWNDKATVHEANGVARFFLIQGWYAYVILGLAYCLGIYWLASILPKKWALTCIFYMILVSFIGGSNWFFYVWRMGMESPVIYGIILSVAIVNFVFVPISRNSQTPQQLVRTRNKIYNFCIEAGCPKS